MNTHSCGDIQSTLEPPCSHGRLKLVEEGVDGIPGRYSAREFLRQGKNCAQLGDWVMLVWFLHMWK